MPFTAGLAKDFRAAGGSKGDYRYKCVESLAALCKLSKQITILSQEELMEWRRVSAQHMFDCAGCRFRDYPALLATPSPTHCYRRVPRPCWEYSDESKSREVKSMWSVVFKGHAVTQQLLLRFLWLGAPERMRS